MGCKSCGKRKQAPPTPETRFDQKVDRPNITVKLSNGKKSPITRALITSQPTGGWGGTYVLDKHDITVDGRTPEEVFERIWNIVQLNKLELTEEDVWLNLNLDWMERTPARFRLTMIDRVKMLTQRKEVEDFENTPIKHGGKMWTAICYYLSKELYEKSDFEDLLNIAFEIVDDPLIGCEYCADHFAKAIEQGVIDGAFENRETARIWVWTTMNRIRIQQERKPLPWDKAVEKHFWFEPTGKVKPTE